MRRRLLSSYSMTPLTRALLGYATDAIPRFTMGCRILPSEAVSLELQAKEVIVPTHSLDKHTLGDVILPDGMNLNQELVKDGRCWWYRKYAPGDTVLEGLENEAREARKGLWADPDPMPPWEWRKKK